MATGIYVRVSHKSQDTKSQEMDLRTWAKSQDDEIVWYRDHHTGTEMTRPGMDKLLADVRCGKIIRIACWRLDRMGRTSRGLLTLLEELQALNVRFVSLREGFDLGTPAGRLMAGMLASFAAYETEVRQERQLTGIAKAKAAGKRWGGRHAGVRIRLTEEKERLIQQLHGEKTPIRVISRVVELAPHTVYKEIRRQKGA